MKEKLLKLRTQILIFLVEKTKPIYVYLFKRDQKKWQQDTKSLKRFPQKSLGHTLGNFLEINGFTLLPKLETHDVLHVLLDYKTTIEGEVEMQFFLLGNRKKSFYALFTALVGFILVPENMNAFINEFRKGRNCVHISNWNFEHLLCEPLDSLKKQVLGQPLNNQKFII